MRLPNCLLNEREILLLLVHFPVQSQDDGNAWSRAGLNQEFDEIQVISQIPFLLCLDHKRNYPDELSTRMTTLVTSDDFSQEIDYAWNLT